MLLLPQFFWTCCQKSSRNWQWQKDENICNDKSRKYLQWQKFENICDDKRLKIFAMTKSWKYLVVRPSRFCSVTRLTGSTCVEFLDYNPITSSLKYTSCKISQSNYFLLVWELKDWVVLSITLRRKFLCLFSISILTSRALKPAVTTLRRDPAGSRSMNWRKICHNKMNLHA